MNIGGRRDLDDSEGVVSLRAHKNEDCNMISVVILPEDGGCGSSFGECGTECYP